MRIVTLALCAGILWFAAARKSVEASTGPIPLNCQRPCLEGRVNSAVYHMNSPWGGLTGNQR